MSTDDARRSDEEDRFTAYLKWAREEVKTWPEWKQNLLGRHLSKKRADKNRQAGDARPGAK